MATATLDQASLPSKIIVGAGSAIAGYWAELPTLTPLLVFLMSVDYGTGLVSAWLRGELSSHRGVRGIFKKLGIFVAIVVAHEISKPIGEPLGFHGDLGAMFAVFYCVNEVISIGENLAKMGVKMPAGFLATLRRVSGRKVD